MRAIPYQAPLRIRLSGDRAWRSRGNQAASAFFHGRARAAPACHWTFTSTLGREQFEERRRDLLGLGHESGQRRHGPRRGREDRRPWSPRSRRARPVSGPARRRSASPEADRGMTTPFNCRIAAIAATRTPGSRSLRAVVNSGKAAAISSETAPSPGLGRTLRSTGRSMSGRRHAPPRPRPSCPNPEGGASGQVPPGKSSTSDSAAKRRSRGSADSRSWRTRTVVKNRRGSLFSRRNRYAPDHQRRAGNQHHQERQAQLEHPVGRLPWR